MCLVKESDHWYNLNYRSECTLDRIWTRITGFEDQCSIQLSYKGIECASSRDRTYDLSLKRRLLYQLSYGRIIICAPERSRTSTLIRHPLLRRTWLPLHHRRIAGRVGIEPKPRQVLETHHRPAAFPFCRRSGNRTHMLFRRRVLSAMRLPIPPLVGAPGRIRTCKIIFLKNVCMPIPSQER